MVKVRAELRCKSKDTVNKYFKLHKLRDLCQVDIYGFLNNKFNFFTKERILPRDLDLNKSLCQSFCLSDQLKAFKDEFGDRQAVKEFLMTLNILNSSDQFQDVEFFKHILKEANYSRSTIHRQGVEYEKRLRRAKEILSRQHNVPNVYEEFIEKLIN